MKYQESQTMSDKLTISQKEIETKMFFDDVVKLNSKVQVKYLNNGKDVNVHIVSTQDDKPTTNDFQKIYEKSPLAVSLIDHVVGDIVKIGSLDNFVEILKVDN